VVFATWKPLRVVPGAYLFGAMSVLQLYGQGLGWSVPGEFLAMLPCAATIIVLILIYRNPRTIRLGPPTSLGRGFHPDA
jgi:general nucleoside transport system permease protein